MATCASCGNEAAEGVTLCEHCGQALNPEGLTTYVMKDPSTGPLFEVRIGHYIKTGWHTFLHYPGGFAGFTLITLLVNIALLFMTKPIPAPWFWLLWYLIIALYSPFSAGVYVVSAKLLQRQACTFSDFCAGFHYFRPLLIFGLINALFWGGDMLVRYHLFWRSPLWPFLFNLASLAFMLAFLFTPMLVIDRRLGLWEAMGLSRRTFQRRWRSFLGFILLIWLLSWIIGSALALMAIVVSGIFPFDLGGYRTVMPACTRLIGPLLFITVIAAYADLFGLHSKEY
jgi:hypothetical protein